MKIFPAIDIKDKKCVRLVKGDFDNKTEYDMSPVDQAGKYKEHGFKNLHIVDLDGALTGETVNVDIIQEIVKNSNLKVEIGGGIRNFDSIQKYNKEHPRCGTSFIMTVILVSIILHVFIPREPLILLYSSRLFLFPVVAGISYELIRFSSITSDNIFSRLLSYPNILMQKLTTAEPDNEMVEVAISAINESIRLDEANKIS